MAISLVAVGAKITAAITNSIINVVNQIGLTRAIPTVSGTGMAVGSDGTITLTAASGALKILNCNTSFKTVIDIYLPTNTSNTIGLQLADSSGTAEASGVAGTSGLYDRHALSVTGTSAVSAGAQALKQTTWLLSLASTTTHHFQVVLFAANATTATEGTVFGIDTQNPMTTSSVLALNSVQHQATTAYPSLVITPSAAITAGTIKITQG